MQQEIKRAPMPRPRRGPEQGAPRESHTQHPADAIAFTLTHSYTRKDIHAAVAAPPPPGTYCTAANAGKSPCPRIVIRVWLQGTTPGPMTHAHQRQRHAHEQAQPGHVRQWPGSSLRPRPQCTWLETRVAVPTHRCARTSLSAHWHAVPQHIGQGRLERGKWAPTPQPNSSLISGSTEQAQSDIHIPTKAARFQQASMPWLLGTCAKDSGPPHQHLSGVPVRRGPYLCLKRDTAPTTECALRPGGGEGAKPSK